ncbi:hypothetical protein HETIRDRAFT_416575 [Heterobasidion irregulare TC 32-1]|uniref:Uncharacterized protein n=1 Tax=Heterobasidion irregulare (strain TC 32-1) TaxID=747525 RepID=W4KBE2_HETIT|nr:uncharacterized protein HETIRDRAFT_416575 [Heterobasidion irregulare TC 32-1]ETW82371.1 hypothetical protein HETIRDRAFT_416575 [Heterobasidion irregulare TC 32-1]
MDDKICPLLPWMHSSKVCKHVFAECRKLVKDFAFTDLIQMMPRLHVSIRAIVLLDVMTDPKARASGYAHTYFNSHGINLGVLACFPTDSEIQSATKDAWEEAENLFNILGVSPSDFLLASHPTLPSINSWYVPGMGPMADKAGSDTDSSEDEQDKGDDEVGDTDELRQLLVDIRRSGFHEHSVDERLLNLQCATVAMDIDDLVQLKDMAHKLSQEEQEANLENDQSNILAVLHAAQLPPVNLPPEPRHAFDVHFSSVDTLDFSLLIEIQQAHKTHRAAHGVRELAVPESTPSQSKKLGKESLQRQIIQEMQALLSQQQD